MPIGPPTADRAAEVKLRTRLDVAAIQNLVLGH
jgi:hypothetical protein